MEWGPCYGCLGVDNIGNVPFTGSFGVYWVVRDLEVRRVLEPLSGLTDSLGKLDAPTMPTAPSAEFCRDFKGWGLWRNAMVACMLMVQSGMFFVEVEGKVK